MLIALWILLCLNRCVYITLNICYFQVKTCKTIKAKSNAHKSAMLLFPYSYKILVGGVVIKQLVKSTDITASTQGIPRSLHKLKPRTTRGFFGVKLRYFRQEHWCSIIRGNFSLVLADIGQIARMNKFCSLASKNGFVVW